MSIYFICRNVSFRCHELSIPQMEYIFFCHNRVMMIYFMLFKVFCHSLFYFNINDTLRINRTCIIIPVCREEALSYVMIAREKWDKGQSLLPPRLVLFLTPCLFLLTNWIIFPFHLVCFCVFFKESLIRHVSKHKSHVKGAVVSQTLNST